MTRRTALARCESANPPDDAKYGERVVPQTLQRIKSLGSNPESFVKSRGLF